MGEGGAEISELQQDNISRGTKRFYARGVARFWSPTTDGICLY